MFCIVAVSARNSRIMIRYVVKSHKISMLNILLLRFTTNCCFVGSSNKLKLLSSLSSDNPEGIWRDWPKQLKNLFPTFRLLKSRIWHSSFFTWALFHSLGTWAASSPRWEVSFESAMEGCVCFCEQVSAHDRTLERREGLDKLSVVPYTGDCISCRAYAASA